MHVSIDYQSCSQSKILYSAWPQLFNDVSNMTLWYFLLLTLDFAWKFNLSNFGIHMTRSFHWSATLDYTSSLLICYTKFPFLNIKLNIYKNEFLHFVYFKFLTYFFLNKFSTKLKFILSYTDYMGNDQTFKYLLNLSQNGRHDRKTDTHYS